MASMVFKGPVGPQRSARAVEGWEFERDCSNGIMAFSWLPSVRQDSPQDEVFV
jgi:hypothetical protein